MNLSANRKGRLLQLLACILLSFFYNTSLAQTVGQTRNNSGDIQIYDGTVFDEPDYGSLGACSVEGRMQFSGGTMRFCNGSTWRNLDSGVNNGTCSTAGQIRRNTTWLEFCNGTNWRKINPTHINGACLNEGGSKNLCNDGTANDGAIPDTSAQWRWRCDGLYGGSNSGTCYKNKPINGVCTNEGASNNLCSAGIANDGAISDTSAQWRWRCDGQYGGSNSGTCYKNKPVNGVCNNATRNACSAGTSNDGAIADTSVYWRWRCDGQYGGSNSGTCQKNKPVNGSCGSAASGSAVTSQPSSNQCSAGSFQDLSDTGSYWQWRCNGQYGGSNSSTCQRARASATVNGTCGSAAGQEYFTGSPPSSNLCATGTASSVSSSYAWTCNGSGGGTSESCCAHKIGNTLTWTVTGGNRNCSGTTVWSGSGSDSYCASAATPAMQAYPSTEFCYRRHTNNSCIITTGRSAPSGCSGCGTANVDKKTRVNSCSYSGGGGGGGGASCSGGARGSNGCYLPATPDGDTAVGTCMGAGSCNATCSNGSWTSFNDNCACPFC